LVGPTIGKIVLQRQTPHADAVAGLPLLDFNPIQYSFIKKMTKRT